jgi:Glycosyl transferase family 2
LEPGTAGYGFAAVKLLQTLLVRDEIDVVEAQISYHLNAGVDFVVATDHHSRDGTTEVLERFAREGYLHLIKEEGPLLDGGWRTRMARLAASEYRADWVINTDADEFWMPRSGTLKDTFTSVPDVYGVVFGVTCHFVPRPDDDAPFTERMVVRASPPAAIHDPTSAYRPHLKAAHRGDPGITVSFGSHSVSGSSRRALHHWHPADVLHFPFRSIAQWENKGSRRARGDKPLGQYVRALDASESGRSAARFESLVVDDSTLEKGIVAGSLAIDTRLRDRQRAVRASSSSVAWGPLDTAAVSGAAAVRDADIVRLRRRLDLAAARVRPLERP